MFEKGFRPSPSKSDRRLDRLVREKIWSLLVETGEDNTYKTRSIDNDSQHVELVVGEGKTLADLAPEYNENGDCMKMGR